MYQNVIVPNDGTLEGRSALAPAGDLAWRCGARVVNVSNTELSDKSSKAAVKGHAIAQSAADVEFWVDLENDLPVAVLAAAQYRTNPIYCVPSPPTRGLLGRRKGVLAPLAAEVATRAEAAVVVVGPVVDIARGLPMTELVAVLDGRDGSDELVVLAEQWAQLFKLRLVLTAVAGPGSIDNRASQQQYLDQRADARRAPGGVGVELVQGDDAVGGLVDLLAEHENCLAMLPPTPVGTAPGALAIDVISRSPRAVVLPRGLIPETPIG
ncbi:MAG: hypothetical protein ACXWCM_09765 [Acidimicrobiales bacterium]